MRRKLNFCVGGGISVSVIPFALTFFAWIMDRPYWEKSLLPLACKKLTSLEGTKSISKVTALLLSINAVLRFFVTVKILGQLHRVVNHFELYPAAWMSRKASLSIRRGTVDALLNF